MSSLDIELAPASPSSSSSAPTTPRSNRLSKRSFRTKSPTTRRRINPRWEGQENIPVFDLLPDELVIRIHSYLDVPTIGHTAQICSRFNEIAQDVPLWRDLSGGKWDLKKGAGAAQTVTKSYYVRKFKSFRREVKLQEELALQRRMRERREEDIYKSSLGLLWCLFGRPYEWICTIAIILFTIFVALRLDQTILWSWALVFIPMLIICYQMFFAPLVYDLLRSYLNCDFEDELAPDKFMRPIFFFLFFLMPLQNGKLINRILVFSPICSILAFVVLLLLRLAGHSIAWWTVILPLFLFSIYLTILPLIVREPVWRDSKWLDHVLPAIGGALFLLFVLFLALKLEKDDIMSWYVVMAPLFVMKGLFVVVCLLLTFFSLFGCSMWLEDRSRWPSDTGSYCIVASAVSVMVLGPLLAFEILVAQYLEQERFTSFSLIFVPLFLLEGFGVCGCCALNLVVLFE